MRLNYYILSEKRMYSTAVKMMLDDLKKINKIYDHVSELKTDLEHSKGTVVIIGPNTVHDPYEMCQDLSRIFPLTAVLLLLNKDDIDYKKAMFAGAVDVLDLEGDEAEVIESIKKAEKVINIKVESDPNVKGEEKEAKVITVCSTKGGVGKTTISVNLAAALSKHNLKVAVVDLDLQFGDVALLFDQLPSQSIYDWVKQSYENGDKSFTPYVLKHKAGIDIVAAPDLPEFAELINGEHIAYLIEAMKKEYDMVIIDTPPAFVETSLVALESSDLILLIASLDLPALKNGKLAIETLDLLGLKEKIHILLNRDSEMEGMTKELIEDVLGLEINGRIPSDYRTVISSINNGEPFVTKAARTPVAKAVMKLAEQLIDSFSQGEKVNKEKKKKGLFFRKKT
ncbi:AAA family ATPase [Halalkalibacter alkaliphilus]|uniref:AAA family ATPase n=1 Tax=Halalkalibacter alkaliphilus TaxID=2917993 RepID=A0A9X2CNJ4_9BACI|nr:AAA family ATPase [Halalkalibacter alkaliphilus]MCL7746728.1 AAA family ATPase [Halalkalibacter alkaliphilus]